MNNRWQLFYFKLGFQKNLNLTFNGFPSTGDEGQRPTRDTKLGELVTFERFPLTSYCVFRRNKDKICPN